MLQLLCVTLTGRVMCGQQIYLRTGENIWHHKSVKWNHLWGNRLNYLTWRILVVSINFKSLLNNQKGLKIFDSRNSYFQKYITLNLLDAQNNNFEFLFKTERMRKTFVYWGNKAEGFYSQCFCEAKTPNLHCTIYLIPVISYVINIFVSAVHTRSHWFRSTVWWVSRIATLTSMLTLVVPLFGIMSWK